MDKSQGDVAQRAISRCAIEAVVWGMPLVNTDMMYQAMVRDAKAGPGSNKILYWSRLSDWKNQTLTPNPGAIYLMPFIDTKVAGPMVLEVPPASVEGSITGNLDDAWQQALEDAGPAGADEGKGGKYLFLPPGYSEKVPAGYIVLASDTYQDFALLRSILSGGGEADIAKAVAYGKRAKLYPLSQSASNPETTFVDAIDVVFDATIPYDLRFFHSLDRMVQYEPWLSRDRVMIDQLKSIGIEKGKPFNPDHKTQEILTQAAREAHEWLDAGYQSLYSPSYFEGTGWALPVDPEVSDGQSTFYAKHDVYPVFSRGITYSMAFIGIKHLGPGQYYLMTMSDSDRQAFDGGNSYHLNVPANVPVKQFWSVTVYDRITHAFIRDMSRLSCSSQDPELRKSADGSVDIYFGPTPPAGKQSNWLPTKPGRQYEIMMRFYAPEKPLFDKTWKVSDVEKVQ